ncbi:MAG: hypothetical protein AAFP02_15645, partial [Bacteroidota bacterium]
MRQGFACMLGIICLLMACSFEEDEAYLPQLEGGYWLALDENDAPSLLKVLPNDQMLMDYEGQLGIEIGALSDMDVWEDQLAIAEAEESR